MNNLLIAQWITFRYYSHVLFQYYLFQLVTLSFLFLLARRQAHSAWELLSYSFMFWYWMQDFRLTGRICDWHETSATPWQEGKRKRREKVKPVKLYLYWFLLIIFRSNNDIQLFNTFIIIFLNILIAAINMYQSKQMLKYQLISYFQLKQQDENYFETSLVQN